MHNKIGLAKAALLGNFLMDSAEPIYGTSLRTHYWKKKAGSEPTTSTISWLQVTVTTTAALKGYLMEFLGLKSLVGTGIWTLNLPIGIFCILDLNLLSVGLWGGPQKQRLMRFWWRNRIRFLMRLLPSEKQLQRKKENVTVFLTLSLFLTDTHTHTRSLSVYLDLFAIGSMISMCEREGERENEKERERET